MTVVIRNTQRRIQLNAGNLTRLTVSTLRLAHPRFTKQLPDVGLRITNDRTIAALNRTYRGKSGPTDILSFGNVRFTVPADLDTVELPLGYDRDDPLDLGDMVVSAEYVHRHRAPSEYEAAWKELIVHGVCHLLGFDHETDQDYAAMKVEEERIVAGLRGECFDVVCR